MDPHSFIARAEAQRWLGIAEKLLMGHDLVGSKTFAIRARESDPRLEAAEQILAVADTLLAAEKRVVGNNGAQQPDFYAILQLARFVQDTDHIAAQYRRLAVLLNPHQNRFPYSDQAFQLVNDAWAVLSNPMRKSMYDSELDFPPPQQMNSIGFNLEQQHHHQQHHQQQQQHNFFSINHMGSGHERELSEPQTFQTRAQQSHQHQQLQQHNFLSQPNPIRPVPVREQEDLFQQREQEQLFQSQVQPFQITSAPQQQTRTLPQPPQPPPPTQPPTPPPPAAPPQPPSSWPQASPLSHPQQQKHLQPQPQQQKHLQPQAQSQTELQQQLQQKQQLLKQEQQQLQQEQHHLQHKKQQVQQQQQLQEKQRQQQLQQEQQQQQELQQKQQQQQLQEKQRQKQVQQEERQRQQQQQQLQEKQRQKQVQQEEQQRQQQQQLQENQRRVQQEEQQRQQQQQQLQEERQQQQLQQEEEQLQQQHQQQEKQSLERNDAPIHLPTQVNSNNGIREEEIEIETETEATSEIVDESPTFWTACPFCFYMYEYPRIYADCILLCDNCKRAFQTIPIPSPPPIIEGQEAYFCCWGFFPVGVSMSHLEKTNGPRPNSKWTPITPLYDASSNAQDHLNGRAAPKKNTFVNKSSGPQIYVDDVVDDVTEDLTNDVTHDVTDDVTNNVADDVFMGISEPSDDSDDEWSTSTSKKKKVKRKKKGSGDKKRAELLPARTSTRNGRIKNHEHGMPVQEGVAAPAVPVAESSKKTVGSNPRRQSVRVKKELGKLDLNVEFNNTEGEEPAPGMTGGNRGHGQGQEDNIEGIEFFEGLDEFLSSLPILSVVNDEKGKAA